VALADGRNHHCECENCREKIPSDWLVVLLNEIDEAYTERGIDTKIAFPAYEETLWPSVTEKIKNPKRFSLTLCPIWRDYTEPVPILENKADVPEFILNKTKPITDIHTVLTCGVEWAERNRIDRLIYDYHFWTHQCLDLSGADIARTINADIKSFKENGFGGLIAQGVGTSMLQMPNIVKNPRIWIPPTLASMITGPIATCIFKLEMNGAPVSSGMGTCGFVGQIGVYTGWVADVASGAKAGITAMDWVGLLLICIVLPAVLSFIFCEILRKWGWIKENDLKLEL
jgi:hypothetical protein